MNTITHNNLEKSLADWSISNAVYRWQNQADETLDLTLQLLADAPDPFPVDSKIILRLNRTPLNGSRPTPHSPVAGATQFTGGKTLLAAYLLQRGRRFASGRAEYISYKFSGPFSYFFSLLDFRKPRKTFDGAAQVTDYDLECFLGYSQIPNGGNVNLLTIRQQLCEIAQYVIAESTRLFGSPQFAFDSLTTLNDGVNFDLIGTNDGVGTALCSIPDYVPGSPATGVGNNTSALPNFPMLRCSVDAVNNVKSSEAWRRTLRRLGGPGAVAVWFDYTPIDNGQPPKLHIATRDKLPAKTLPFTGNTTEIDLTPRDDLIPTCVNFRYNVHVTSGGNTYSQILNDIALIYNGAFLECTGPIGQLYNYSTAAPIPGGDQTAIQAIARGWGSYAATLDIDGGNTSTTTNTATIACLAVNLNDPHSDSTSLPFWKTVLPHLASAGDLSIQWNSIVDPESGASLAPSLADYPYILTQGSGATWMAGNTALFQRARITAVAKYTEQYGLGTTDWHPQTADITLTNIPGGTYILSNTSTFSLGEPAPMGLAGYILKIESVLQWQGSYTFIEQDVTGQFLPGSALNLSGGLKDWTAMNAFPQDIAIDLNNATTRIQVGPAAHLGPSEAWARMQADRGLNGKFYLNSNLLNAL